MVGRGDRVVGREDALLSHGLYPDDLGEAEEKRFGAFDLDDSESMAIFETYVGR